MFLGIRDPGSEIRDGKNPDPGSGINIPDPQHWYHHYVWIHPGQIWLQYKTLIFSCKNCSIIEQLPFFTAVQVNKSNTFLLKSTLKN
jgi:hypothetical protein